MIILSLHGQHLSITLFQAPWAPMKSGLLMFPVHKDLVNGPDRLTYGNLNHRTKEFNLPLFLESIERFLVNPGLDDCCNPGVPLYWEEQCAPRCSEIPSVLGLMEQRRVQILTGPSDIN